MTKIVAAFDTETRLITPTDPWPEVVCLQWAASGFAELIGRADSPNAIRELWLSLLQTDDVTLVAHQSDYDLGVLSEHEPSSIPLIFKAIDQDRIKDTKLVEMLKCIADGTFAARRNRKGGFSLEHLSGQYLNKPMDKGEDGWRLRYAELIDIPSEQWPERARHYALNDATSTLEIYEKQIADGYQPRDLQLQVSAQWALGLMKRRGIVTNKTAVDALEAKLTVEMQQHEGMLKSEGILRPDGSRDMKRVRALIEQAAHTLQISPALTDGGQIATSAEALEPYEGAVPSLTAMIQYLKKQKKLGTFIPVVRAGTERPIHPGWNVLMETGRTSCSGDSGNLMNIPRSGGERECIVPRPGMAYVIIDYEVAELRALAQLCYSWFKESKLREAFVEGRDPHFELGAAIHGVSYQDMLALKKAGDPIAKEMRQLAKVPNFGFPGGLGAATFVSYARSMGVRLTLQRAEELKRAWKAQWPEMEWYFRVINEQTGDGSARSITQWGSGRVRGDVSYCEAANGHFQSAIADILKRALYLVSRACYAEVGHVLSNDCHPVLENHDEIVLECPWNYVHECAEAAGKIMLDVMQEWLPDVPPGIEAKAALCWSKDAERIVENGRLKIWTQTGAQK